MNDELRELQRQLQHVLDGKELGSVETIWGTLLLCAAKRDGYLDDLLSILDDFLNDIRICNVKDLARLFININVELDCLEEKDINILVRMMAKNFHRIEESAKFSICELWGSLGTAVVLAEIDKIVPSDDQERNFLAHALGHIIKKSTKNDIVAAAKKILTNLGGNPDIW